MNWKLIDTAPKEPYASFLVYFPENDDVGWGDCICEALRLQSGALTFGSDGEYREQDGIVPTHWAPRELPQRAASTGDEP